MGLKQEDKQALLARLAAIREANPEMDYVIGDFALAAGVEAMDKLAEVAGGEKPHIPEDPWRRIAHLVRDHDMRKACGPGKEKNYRQLAIQFSNVYGLGELSEHRVREIVDKAKRKTTRAPEVTQPVKAAPEVYASIRELSDQHGIAMREVLTEGWLWLMEHHGPEFKKAMARKFGTQLQMVVGDR